MSENPPEYDDEETKHDAPAPVLSPEEQARAQLAQIILLIIMAFFIITPFVVWFFLNFKKQ